MSKSLTPNRPNTSLLPPNSTQLERALEAVFQELIDDISIPIASLWNADTVSIDLLPYLAWTLGVDSWKPYWSETVKRNRVRQAIEIARHKGTRKAVEDVVTAFGGYVAIREWWELDPPGPPYTFQMTLTLSDANGADSSAQYVNDIIAEVNKTKPARAHFTFTQGLQARADIRLIATTRTMTYVHLQFEGVA